MARVAVPSGWMTWPAQEVSHISMIRDCRQIGWGNHDCTHSRDASVQCSHGSPNIRLVNGGAYYGRVEVNHGG